ncbi:hypothetical protein BDY17DRAFT_302559 [Neohortaea acidophila]|uniref:WD40-repeat-containing domain protein n=1 Tax=Neohortaea acidophila TaxID=245834 RepID=A0A6A6PN63_9PEZI|nr:uncharacterized protein BDY17DRAFT_302559 [Neohortaea acidophila]KAF2480873.1 hypothetical protein BDY17DRAFT_302559 [Neohortaea acidophila]
MLTCLDALFTPRLHQCSIFNNDNSPSMEMSEIITGAHAVASPCGSYVASLSAAKLRISSTWTPERYTHINIRPVKDVTALKWSQDSNRLAILSPQHVEVVCLDDAHHRVRLDNGSGGLGRFASVDFVGADHLLVIWEFGKAKLWSLSEGKGVELADVKTVTGGQAWQIRPGHTTATSQVLAILTRQGSDDLLNIYFPHLHKQLSSTKLSTVDAQSISWSPDGRWLTVLDTPTAPSSVHIFTPDGHLFRTYPSSTDSSTMSLGIKSAIWSSDSRVLALTRHDSRILLLNTRTFAPLAIIEHSTTIDQRSSPPDQQSPIWQESVTASGQRSYIPVSHPVSPPLSKPKSTADPADFGIAEARFNCTGSHLATRDERMLNTVWIWDMSSLVAHAVLIQHSNVRRLRWHPTRPDMLLLDCGERIPYIFSIASAQPPTPFEANMPFNLTFTWAETPATSNLAFLAISKTTLRIMYPEGQPSPNDEEGTTAPQANPPNTVFDEGNSDDSLFDVLSGRKPLPPKTEPSYTERIDWEVETEEENSLVRVDDTFREKRRKSVQKAPATSMILDPLDDSEIF